MASVDVDDGFGEVEAAVADRGMRALRAGAEIVQARARELAPKKSGALAASIQVTVSDDEAAVHTSSPYAVKQHEKLGFKHPSGQAKYLETALLANQSDVQAAIAEVLDLS
ncbi:HK97 gp10 family phage protein [Gordonia sp. PP30]|uniref:HK97 gp10 family phage protein n=1 Tax=Gordonia sp. PP30 TaxID=2935861 RepID=UPI001FFE79D1|nr:HK97 gp10 family phage protein [Gordonia sp. PP30]UQE74194.1 HK97 gp10 family phage protein [Gordonia sp. PP30]